MYLTQILNYAEEFREEHVILNAKRMSLFHIHPEQWEGCHSQNSEMSVCEEEGFRVWVWMSKTPKHKKETE